MTLTFDELEKAYFTAEENALKRGYWTKNEYWALANYYDRARNERRLVLGRLTELGVMKGEVAAATLNYERRRAINEKILNDTERIYQQVNRYRGSNQYAERAMLCTKLFKKMWAGMTKSEFDAIEPALIESVVATIVIMHDYANRLYHDPHY